MYEKNRTYTWMAKRILLTSKYCKVVGFRVLNLQKFSICHMNKIFKTVYTVHKTRAPSGDDATQLDQYIYD